MAINIFTGTTNSNWGTSTNWSLGTVPAAADGNITTFNALSPSCTVNTNARSCNNIDFTGYANTITMSFSITVSGDITFGAGMIVAGTATLASNSTGNLKSNGFTWPLTLSMSGNFVRTLLDNWTVQNASLSATAGSINGFQLKVLGNCTANMNLSTTLLVLAPPVSTIGTWTLAATVSGFNVQINGAGNLNIVGSGFWGGSGTTLTYTAGTVNASTSTLSWVGASIMNTGTGVVWGNVVVTSGTVSKTLASDMYVGGTFSDTTAVSNNQVNGVGMFLYVAGNFDLSTKTTGSMTGTATVVMNGTSGTSTIAGGLVTSRLGNPLTINSTNAVVIAGNQSLLNVPLTITAATSVTPAAGASLTLTGTSAIVCNKAGVEMPDLLLNVDTSFGGSQGFGMTGLIVSGAGIDLVVAAGKTYTIHNTFTFVGVKSTPATISTSLSGTRSAITLDVLGAMEVAYTTTTDIDSSAGPTIWDFGGSTSNTLNWITPTRLLPIVETF